MPPGETRSPAAPAGAASPHAVARWCAAQGWPVHPLAPGRKTPAANCRVCREQKHDVKSCPCLPAGRACHGFHAATTNAQVIDAWWSTTPSAGVGIACGPAGLVVVDVDAHPASVPDRSRLLPGIAIPESVNLTGLASGFDTLALLAAYRRQPDPAHDETTLRVRTPSVACTSGTKTLTPRSGCAARPAPAPRWHWPGRWTYGRRAATSSPPPPAPARAVTSPKARPGHPPRCPSGCTPSSYAPVMSSHPRRLAARPPRRPGPVSDAVRWPRSGCWNPFCRPSNNARAPLRHWIHREAQPRRVHRRGSGRSGSCGPRHRSREPAERRASGAAVAGRPQRADH